MIANPVTRVALVTAGGKRIGAAIALRLAQSGWQLAIHCRDSVQEAQQLSRELQAIGAQTEVFRADLASDSEVEGLFDAVVEHFGQLDAVVNNASEFSEPEEHFFDWSQFERLMRINLGAPLLLSQCLYRRMKAQDTTGVVLNLLDQKLWNRNPDFLTYTLTKAALREATQLLAQRCAPYVRVNAIAPGLTLPGPDQSLTDFERTSQLRLNRHPVDPQDLACAADFLLSTSSLNGSVLLVDAGQHLVPMIRDFSHL